MSDAEEWVAFGGLIGVTALLFLTPYGVHAALVYVCFAFWRVQVHSRS